MSLKPIGYRLVPIDIRSLYLVKRDSPSSLPRKRNSRGWLAAFNILLVLGVIAWASTLTSHKLLETFNYPKKALRMYSDMSEKSQQFMLDSKNARIKQMEILKSETYKVRPLTHFRQPIRLASFTPKQVNPVQIISQQIPTRWVQVVRIPTVINAQFIVQTSHSMAIAGLAPNLSNFRPINMVRPANLFIPVKIPTKYESSTL